MKRLILLLPLSLLACPTTGTDRSGGGTTQRGLIISMTMNRPTVSKMAGTSVA